MTARLLHMFNPTTARILTYFYYNRRSSYLISEIADAIKHNREHVRRKLDILAKVGVLDKEGSRGRMNSVSFKLSSSSEAIAVMRMVEVFEKANNVQNEIRREGLIPC